MEILKCTLRKNSPLLLGARKADKENTPPSIPANASIGTCSAEVKPASCGFTDFQSKAEDARVKVVVRIRNSGKLLSCISPHALTVEGDRTFHFHSVLDPAAAQEDVFETVGVPLVQDSLNGFNASLVAYGQSGSGKTYTLWGPLSSMVEANCEQGIVPRAFRLLFSEIHKMQEASGEKPISFQCRCSFLEIYNGQINDLLDPTQRNLQIKDDACSGTHVENLTDEYVMGIDDVNQILVKGLSNRKVGATSVNSKSSRSHVIFTCIIESWSKGISSNCFSSSRTSRITFVDLAGPDKDDADTIDKLCIKEEKYIKKSISNLGMLVNILAGVADDQEIPYRDSSLTHLLQDTFGGNSKATVICTISDEDRCRAGTFSTLRFGERAKCIRNKAVINEITEDDVNGLGDQIRQLKEELVRAKTGDDSTNNNTSFGGKHARESLNFLRMSLNRSLVLPHLDVNSEEEMEVDEEDVRDLCSQISNLHSSTEESFKDFSDAELSSDDIICSEQSDEDRDEDEDSCVLANRTEDACIEKSIAKSTDSLSLRPEGSPACHDPENKHNQPCKSPSLPASPIHEESMVQLPTLCSSPKSYGKRKSSIFSSMLSISKESVAGFPVPTMVTGSPRQDTAIRSSLQSTKLAPTESLAASLKRGIDIIEHHQQSLAPRKSLVALSFDHLARQSMADALLCSSCKRSMGANKCSLSNETSEQNALASESHVSPTSAKVCNGGSLYVGKSVVELQALCGEQAAKIQSLTLLVSKYEQDGNAHKSSGMIKELGYKEQTNLEHKRSDAQSEALDASEKEALLTEIQTLRDQLKRYSSEPVDECLLDQIRNGGMSETEVLLERERQKWTESESRWISLAEELRADLESNRRHAEKMEMELCQEKACTAELDDALRRAIHGHIMFVEHYTELQEAHNDLYEKHRRVMEGIAEVKKAAAKAGNKGRRGTAFAAALAAELSSVRVDRAKERACLKEQNRRLRIQLRDTAEAVHAAGELLVRLREAEAAAADAAEKHAGGQKENERLRQQLEEVRREHAMELAALRQCLAESRLPQSALEQFYRREEEAAGKGGPPATSSSLSWTSAFSPAYM